MSHAMDIAPVATVTKMKRSEVRKEMRIKHLPDNLPVLTAKNCKIPKGSRGVRPQGKLPKDWKPPVY